LPQNEAEICEAVLEAIAAGDLSDRNDVYVTSKISPYEHGTAKATAACEAILQRLGGLEYVDLVLIHWPGAAKTDPASPRNAELRKETWRVLEHFYALGRFKALGVSNYEVRHLDDLIGYAHVPPSVLQAECHPLFPQPLLRQFAACANMQFVAYASFGGGQLLSHPTVQAVADQAGKSPAQTLLCWALQKGCCVIPKSVRPERIAEFSPTHSGLQPRHEKSHGQGRYLNEASEAALDALGATSADWRKFCWDPSVVVH
jgi:diketogulonate reductase-like aldo/keto reductase